MLLSLRDLPCCGFQVRRSAAVGSQPRCIVGFRPRTVLPCTLCCKGLCVSGRQLSFAQTRFFLSVGSHGGTARTVLQGGPFKLQFGPIRISFLIGCGRHGKLACLDCVHGNIHFGYS